MSGSGPTPRLVCLPSSDEAFAEHVRRVTLADPPSSPEAFEERLRRIYPRATVRRREPAGETHELWYVFRETPYPVSSDHWWRTPDAARVAVTFGGIAVEANEGLLALLRVPREELVGAHYSRFVPPEALPDAAELMAIVLRRQRGASVVTLQRGDGTRVECEWRAQVRGRRLRVFFREV